MRYQLVPELPAPKNYVLLEVGISAEPLSGLTQLVAESIGMGMSPEPLKMSLLVADAIGGIMYEVLVNDIGAKAVAYASGVKYTKDSMVYEDFRRIRDGFYLKYSKVKRPILFITHKAKTAYVECLKHRPTFLWLDPHLNVSYIRGVWEGPDLEIIAPYKAVGPKKRTLRDGAKEGCWIRGQGDVKVKDYYTHEEIDEEKLIAWKERNEEYDL
jgi:hypothetical protein